MEKKTPTSLVPFSQLFVAGSCELHNFSCHNWRCSLGPIDIIVGIKVNLNTVPQGIREPLTHVVSNSSQLRCKVSSFFSTQKWRCVLHSGHTQSFISLKTHFKLLCTYLDQHWCRNTCSWGFLSHLWFLGGLFHWGLWNKKSNRKFRW